MSSTSLRITARRIKNGSWLFDRDFFAPTASDETYYFCASELTRGRFLLHRDHAPARWIVEPGKPIIGEMWFFGYLLARFEYTGRSNVTKAEFAPMEWGGKIAGTNQQWVKHIGYLQRQSGRPPRIGSQLRTRAANSWQDHSIGLVGVSKSNVEIIKHKIGLRPKPPLDLRKVMGLINGG